jgi:hypothetical protein
MRRPHLCGMLGCVVKGARGERPIPHVGACRCVLSLFACIAMLLAAGQFAGVTVSGTESNYACMACNNMCNGCTITWSNTQRAQLMQTHDCRADNILSQMACAGDDWSDTVIWLGILKLLDTPANLSGVQSFAF